MRFPSFILRTRGVAVIAALVLPVALRAQAPHITAQGDPSVKDDTLYRLAVDPADHPDESYVYLLDDGVARWEKDGSGSETYRQVVQILKDDAVETWAEQSFSYDPSHQKMHVNWIRVVKPDGTVISPSPTHDQESDVPAAMDAPVYSDRKVHRYSLAGVAPGTIVDYSYTLEELKPWRTGDIFQTWSTTTGHTTRRSRLIVDLPASMKPIIAEWNMKPHTEQVAGDRRVYTWTAQDLTKPRAESYVADSDGVSQHLAIAAPGTWKDVARWYAGLANGRYTVGAPLAHTIDSLVAKAKTRDDTIRIIHRWVAQDFRYVSVSLGVAGYQPRRPDSTFATMYGDCKDKATIFVAALGHVGIEAYPVLLNSDGGVERGLPTIDQFDHVIAAVKNRDGTFTYTDLTSDLSPYGQLGASEQGEFGLMVFPNGDSREITFPEDSIGANRVEKSLVGVLDTTGHFSGHYEERETGFKQFSIRNAFFTPLDSTKRAAVTRNIAARLFSNGEGDSLVLFDGKDLTAKPYVSVQVHGAEASRNIGTSDLLDTPFGNMKSMADAARALEAEKPRRTNIDAKSVFGRQVSVTEVRITLPEHWHARLPKNVLATSEFGKYEVTYSQTGRDFTMVRTFTGAKGVFGPEHVDALIAWFKAMAQDDAEYIVLEH